MSADRSAESAQLLAVAWYIAGMSQDWAFTRVLMFSLSAFWFIQAVLRARKGDA